MYIQREKFDQDCIHERIGLVMGKIGPSMLLTSISESTAFFLGYRSFDIYHLFI